MKDNSIDYQKMQELLDKKQKQTEEILNSASVIISEHFPEEKQKEVILEIYGQVLKLSQDVEDLSMQNIYLSSFIDAFQSKLVGEGKLITEEEYLALAEKSYTESIDSVTEAYKSLEKED